MVIMHWRNRWGEFFLVFFMLGSFHRHSCYFKMWDECCLCSDKTLFLLCLSDFYSLVVLRLVWVVIRKRTVLTIHLTICQTFLHFQVLLFLLHVYPFIVSVIKTRRTRISLFLSLSLSCWPLLISRHVFFFSCLTFFYFPFGLDMRNQSQYPCLSFSVQPTETRDSLLVLRLHPSICQSRFNLSCWASWLQRLPFVLCLKSIFLFLSLSFVDIVLHVRKKKEEGSRSALLFRPLI